ncbi:MAG: sulfatase-like hydrolase/transferase [Eubacteriaceae bacterium]|nr:sulfatase-like hydrolase/transferase [Eubacteriaceae bacterium]
MNKNNKKNKKMSNATVRGLKKREEPLGITDQIKGLYGRFYVGPKKNINLIGVGVVVLLLAAMALFGDYVFAWHYDYIFPYLISVGIIGMFLVFPFPERLRDNTIWNVLMVILCVYLICTMIQIASGLETIPVNSDNDPYGISQFLLSIVLIVGIIALFCAISGNIGFSIIILSVALLILCTVNYFIIEFRGDLLYVGDFLAAGTAAEVANGYQIAFRANTFIAIVMLAAVTLCALHMIRQRAFNTGFRTRLVSLVIAGVCVFGIVAANPFQYLFSWDASRNHYLLAFGVNAIQMHQPAPKGYSTESVRGIVENNQNTQKGALKSRTVEDVAYENGESTPDVKHPTVIAIMNESFSDLSVLGDLKTNEDYMPFFHSLNSKDANVIKGKLYVDVFGGGTCNSEYSFLTGNTTAFLPENTRPFQLYVDHNTPSLVKTLKAQGYETSGLHPGEAANWNRNTAYPALGFEHTYFFDQSYIDAHIVRNFMGDDATYRKVIDIYEKGEGKPQFIFDVTMAGHGGYDMGGTEKLAHQIRGQDNLSGLPTLDEYLTVLRECDGALQVLIDYFEKQEDPVVIVFFGDHQPKLENDFYDRIKNKPKSEWNAEDNLSMQVTPYLIWSNYDFEGQAEDEDISVNFLQQKVLRAAGLETTAYDNYEAALVKDYPIVSVKGIVDKNGKYQIVRDAKKEDRQIADYQQVVYNNMIDAKNRVTDLFTIETRQTH